MNSIDKAIRDIGSKEIIIQLDGDSRNKGQHQETLGIIAEVIESSDNELYDLRFMINHDLEQGAVCLVAQTSTHLICEVMAKEMEFEGLRVEVMEI